MAQFATSQREDPLRTQDLRFPRTLAFPSENGQNGNERGQGRVNLGFWAHPTSYKQDLQTYRTTEQQNYRLNMSLHSLVAPGGLADIIYIYIYIYIYMCDLFQKLLYDAV